MNNKIKLILKWGLTLVLIIVLWYIGKNSVEKGVPYTKQRFNPLEEADKGNPHGIDINTCSQDDLMQFYGIGPKYSENIIKAREEMGGFKSIDDLLYAEGIGAKRLNAMRSHIKIR